MFIYYDKNKIPKKIYVKESSVKSIAEGVEFKKGSDGFDIDTTITPIKFNDDSGKDKNNKLADTRFFGTKNDILYGDETIGKKTYSLSDLYINMGVLIKAYRGAIEEVEAGHRDNPKIKTCPMVTRNSILKKMNDKSLSDEALIDYFNERIVYFSRQYEMTKEKYERTIDADDDEPKLLPRYDVSVVPGTDVKLIALFKFEDFNFSDAIKNAELRQTPRTDSILGIDKSERKANSKLYGKGLGTNKKLNTSYDNGLSNSSVSSNFSLTGIEDDKHEKQQFKSRSAFNSDEEFEMDSKERYSTVTQFMDKSILAARYALNNEGVKVDYIVSAPSSSKFNDYYCTNLSRKLGVEYKKDFFSRNLINVVLDDEIYNAGLAPHIIEKAKYIIKEAALTEISALLMDDVKKFVNENYKDFASIPNRLYSREKIDKSLVCEFIKHYSYYGLCNINDDRPKTSNVYMYLVNHFMDYVEIKPTKRDVDVEYILKYIISILKTKLSRKYQELLKKLDNRIKICSKYLKDENGGWKLSYSKKFKITDIDLKARPFVKNAYVVSDSELDVDDNLFERYRNANFLIVDEDINSGGTLKLLVDALKDKVVGHVGKRGRRAKIKSDQLTCLVNAYYLK